MIELILVNIFPKEEYPVFKHHFINILIYECRLHSLYLLALIGLSKCAHGFVAIPSAVALVMVQKHFEIDDHIMDLLFYYIA